MIVVDTSVLIAILQHEPEHDAFIQFIATHQPASLSAVSLQEAGMLMRSRRGAAGITDLDDLLAALQIRVAAYDERQARTAIDAFAKFGKGMHATARLNLGDCAAYALAKTSGSPLMFKGDDFKATDIAVAI